MSNGPLRIELGDGLSLNFGTGPILSGDVYEFTTTAPMWHEPTATLPPPNRHARRAARSRRRHAAPPIPVTVKVTL